MIQKTTPWGPPMKKLLISGLGKLGYRSHLARHFTDARLWSNDEIMKFGHLYDGNVINVSAWEDKDKNGNYYKSYFPNATNYYISNFGTDQGVLQGSKNEFFIDLTAPLDSQFINKFSLVFNHTTLEHVFEFRTAFDNLCTMTSDSVMIVVPWLQQLHATYGDYWRFSPQALVKLFEKNDMKTIYLSWTEKPRTSVYVFAIGTKQPQKWIDKIGAPLDSQAPDFLIPPLNRAGLRAF
jgi:hypothetical protein